MTNFILNFWSNFNERKSYLLKMRSKKPFRYQAFSFLQFPLLWVNSYPMELSCYEFQWMICFLLLCIFLMWLFSHVLFQIFEPWNESIRIFFPQVRISVECVWNHFINKEIARIIDNKPNVKNNSVQVISKNQILQDK